ncbi:MAG: DUF503 family protein [Verrucomicrobiia bacterium]
MTCDWVLAVVVGLLQVELTIPSADSLKAKRMVLRSFAPAAHTRRVSSDSA